MKKIKLITIVSLIVILIFSLAGCGGDTPDDKNTEWTIVKEATCTEEGKKEKYLDGQLVQETIPQLGHNYDEWKVTLQETCTTDGKEERECIRCHNKEDKVIEAHHVLKTGYAFDINTHYYECENCEEKINLSNHNFNIDKEDKYAYMSSDRIYLGYVATLTCKDCNIKIEDIKLLNYHDFKFGMCENGNTVAELISTVNNDLLFNEDFLYTTDFMAYNATIEYDSNNNPISITPNYKDNDLLLLYGFEKIQYTYDETGKLTKQTLVYSNRQINVSHVYENIENGYTMKLVNDENNSVALIYTFNNQDKLVKYEQLSLGIEIEYENGYIIKGNPRTLNFDQSSQNIEYRNNVYDENGYRTSYDLYCDDQLKYTVTTQIDTNGNIIMINLSTGEKIEFNYENNDLLSFKYISSDGLEQLYTCKDNGLYNYSNELIISWNASYQVK